MLGMNGFDPRNVLAIGISLFIHLLFAGLLEVSEVPSFWQWMRASSHEIPEGSRFQIQALSQDELRQLRTVGVRGGQSDGFSTPVPQGNDLSLPIDHQDMTPVPPAGSEHFAPQTRVGMEALAPELDRPTPAEVRIRSLQNQQAPDQAARIARQQEQIQGNILRELGASPQAAEAIRRAGFNVQFDAPEGIEEDELNTVEKIFYSFQRRTFYSYVTNFIMSYQRLIFSKPHMRQVLERETFHLIGRVEFDQAGHVISLRLLRTSQHPDVNLMFEETLKNLNLPNPPEDLLNTENRLVIHFQLRMN
jgi:hypothetical protein